MVTRPAPAGAWSTLSTWSTRPAPACCLLPAACCLLPAAGGRAPAWRQLAGRRPRADMADLA